MKESSELLSPYFEIPTPSVKELFFFNVSHTYTNLGSTKPPHGHVGSSQTELFHIIKAAKQPSFTPVQLECDRILPKIYLGQIPLKFGNSSDATKIQEFIASHDPDAPLALVVSALNYFEIAGRGLAMKSVTPKDWEALNVKHHLIRMSDFAANACPSNILNTVLAIKQCQDRGFATYVHCKAGKGRSAIIILVFLMMFGNNRKLHPNSSLEDALAYLKSIRPQICPNNLQLEVAQIVVNLAKELNIVERYSRGAEFLEPSFERLNETNDLNRFLASIEAKSAIRHLASFKELAIYACQHLPIFFGQCQRSDHIRELFRSIYKAEDASWYFSMMKNEGPLQRLKIATPFPRSIEDEFRRQTITDSFKTEVTDFLAKNLRCNPRDFLPIVEKECVPSPTLSLI